MADSLVNMATLHRPKKFSDMVGQPFATGVGKQIGKGKISGQGYILAGPKGCGKTSVARIIAMSLNCPQRDEDTGDPCLTCESCVSALSSYHPQIDELNASINRGIGDIRARLESMNLAIPSGYRVYIIDEVHQLTKDAFSALLKPIEEPPENVVFIMATTNPESIPDTIVSRAPIIPILPMTDGELTTILDNVVASGRDSDPETWDAVTNDDVAVAVSSASGSARQAITNLSGAVFHGVSNSDFIADVDSIVDGFVSGSVEAVLSSAMSALSDKTSEPLTIISTVMDRLLDRMKNTSEVYAREVAALSAVASEVSISSPAVMTASKIASCVPLRAQETSPAVEVTTEPESPWEAPETSSVRVPQFAVTSSTGINAILEFLFETDGVREVLGEKLYGILDDEGKSDIWMNNGSVNIAVPKPTKKMHSDLSSIISKVTLHTLKK